MEKMMEGSSMEENTLNKPYTQWYGHTPESEELTPEEFDRRVRIVRKQLSEFDGRCRTLPEYAVYRTK